MKKLFLSLSVLASLLMAGCSGDDAEGIDGSEGESSTRYMCVNIVLAGGSETRTDDELYEYGLPEENKVTKVRFYFFTENGAASNAKLLPNGQYVNYYDWTPQESDNTPTTGNNNNVGSIMSTIIIINSKEGDKLPREIVAVLNPPATLTGSSTVQGLTTLRAIEDDYAKGGLTTAGNFVMSNSVYGEGTPVKEVCAVYIKNDNICDTEAAAMDTPVYMYVERNVAKVNVKLGENLYSGIADNKYDTTTKRLKLKDKDKEDITVTKDNTDTQVYLQLDGWSLTAETDKGYLIKRINTLWDTDWWNYGMFRSTWALNSPTAQNKWVPNYRNINKAFGTSAYTNENAAPFSNGGTTTELDKTKFIIKGRLCDESGNALTLVRHWGNLFADTYTFGTADSLPNLRKSILDMLHNYKRYYKVTDNNTLTQIEVGDIVIKANTTQPRETSNNNCYVHAELTDEAKTKTWYIDQREMTEGTTLADPTTSTTSVTVTTADAINSDLGDKEIAGEALVWKEGRTYYYSEITHRNHNVETPATYGVVRNHVYYATITDIAGLGTPVYNPEEIIYPEKPDQDDHYIAAQINILAWRIVSDDYSIEW